MIRVHEHRLERTAVSIPRRNRDLDAAAASPASALAIANARALSARLTRPAPSAALRHALFAVRIA
jgi:hypothetical protein